MVENAFCFKVLSDHSLRSWLYFSILVQYYVWYHYNILMVKIEERKQIPTWDMHKFVNQFSCLIVSPSVRNMKEHP